MKRIAAGIAAIVLGVVMVLTGKLAKEEQRWTENPHRDDA